MKDLHNKSLRVGVAMNIKKKATKGLIVLLLTASFPAILVGCTSNDYDETLESGYEKYVTGEEMTEEEYDAVKSYNDWADKQGEKTYDNWNE